MLPDDPDASTPEAQLTDSAPESAPTDEATFAIAPAATPATEPVRRRGWPFAVAIVLVAVLGGSALFMSGVAVGRDVGKSPGSSISDAQAWQPLWDVYNAV